MEVNVGKTNRRLLALVPSVQQGEAVTLRDSGVEAILVLDSIHHYGKDAVGTSYFDGSPSVTRWGRKSGNTELASGERWKPSSFVP